MLARAIRRRKPALKRAAAERAALVTVTASIALLDLASMEPRHGATLLAETDTLREAYLSRYLD